jgi:hypothetical protein
MLSLQKSHNTAADETTDVGPLYAEDTSLVERAQSPPPPPTELAKEDLQPEGVSLVDRAEPPPAPDSIQEEPTPEGHLCPAASSLVDRVHSPSLPDSVPEEAQKPLVCIFDTL